MNMKKNYVKPSLLSETFVTENIMEGTETVTLALSQNLKTKNGETFAGINFNDGNALQ